MPCWFTASATRSASSISMPATKRELSRAPKAGVLAETAQMRLRESAIKAERSRGIRPTCQPGHWQSTPICRTDILAHRATRSRFPTLENRSCYTSRRLQVAGCPRSRVPWRGLRPWGGGLDLQKRDLGHPAFVRYGRRAVFCGGGDPITLWLTAGRTRGRHRCRRLPSGRRACWERQRGGRRRRLRGRWWICR